MKSKNLVDVLGLPYSQAAQIILKSGYELGTVTYTSSPKIQNEQVIKPRVVRQRVTVGGKVDLVLASCPW